MSKYGKKFEEVLSYELDAIRARRAYLRFGLDVIEPGGEPPSPPQQDGQDAKTPQQQAIEMNLTGLALSGGGIRSGTYALGVIQAFAKLGLLDTFDYLSTVSGGGYIGSWLTAWIKREGNLANVERQLSPRRLDEATSERRVGRDELAEGGVFDEEPEPLHHLRSYSDYLTPQPGLFSADTWSLFAIYLRNLLVNMLMLLPAATALVALAWLVVKAYGSDRVFGTEGHAR